MTIRSRILCLSAALLGATAAAQQVVTLPVGSWANDVTPDGEIVVGTYNFGSGFIWRWRVDPAPTVILGGDVVAVSDDGSVLAGNVQDATGKEVAAIWTQAAGWQALGGLPGGACDSFLSSAYAISGDGTTVVGLGWASCSGRGFRWTAATGMQELQKLANGGNRCSAISRDGSTLGGFAQGTFNRTPAYWAPNLTGAVIDANLQGEVHGFNNNGSRSVGTLYFTGSLFDAFVRDQQTGATTNLGSIHTNWAAAATDISEDGNVIVGYDYISLSRQAWVWTSSDGMIALNDRLTALGVTGAPPLLVCRAVSDNGNIIVGGAQSAGGGPFGIEGFIVQLSSLEPYGLGTPGCAGPVLLSGSPAPHINTPTFKLYTAQAPPLSAGVVVLTSVQDVQGSDPFALGALLHVNVLTPSGYFLLNSVSNASGIGVANTPIPNSPTLVGATLYAQSVWLWPSSACTLPPNGFSTSNGLAITFLP